MKEKNIRKALRMILHTDKSNRNIAVYTGFHHETIKKYRNKAEANDLSPLLLQEKSDDELKKMVQGKRAKSAQKRMPVYSYVHKALSHKGVTLMLLWCEYVQEDPDTAYCYSQFNYYYRKFLSKIQVVMRQTHFAGEEVFVDFAGKTVEIYDADAMEYFKAQIFVAVLGCSKYTFAYACRSQKIEDWIECHNRMMNFLGGVPQAVVPDNLKAAVDKPGKIPDINRTYSDWADHYGCHVFPARVRKPQDKSLAELGVKLVTRWALARLRNRQFFSLDELNAALAPLIDVLNERPFKRLPGCRHSRFIEMDKPLLNLLPEKEFPYGEWTSKSMVAPDYHVYVHDHAYSVPYKFVGDRVEAKVTAKEIEIFQSGRRICIHTRSFVKGDHTTNPTHRPIQHQFYANQRLEDFIVWAGDIGEHTVALVEAQFDGKQEHSVVAAKACDQLRNLCRLHGNERFESACGHAIQLKSRTVKSVRAILQSKADLVPPETPPEPTLPPHSNIRGADYYSGGLI